VSLVAGALAPHVHELVARRKGVLVIERDLTMQLGDVLVVVGPFEPARRAVMAVLFAELLDTGADIVRLLSVLDVVERSLVVCGCGRGSGSVVRYWLMGRRACSLHAFSSVTCRRFARRVPA
jgi:hypothetical protein